MQKIQVLEQPHHLPPFAEIYNLFELYSNPEEINAGGVVPKVSEAATGLIKCLQRGEGVDRRFSIEKVLPPLFGYPSDKTIFVCFSGGKDSTAAALVLKKAGFDVHLFHVAGINAAYPDEVKSAEELASEMGLPLHIWHVKISGLKSKNCLENPVKNQVLITMAMEYAHLHQMPMRVAIGDFTDDVAADGAFDRNWSDTAEMWDALREYYARVLPNAQIEILFKNYLDTYKIITSPENKNVLTKVKSCILPMRYRPSRIRGNEQKYKIKLLPNRCGSCWKCCVEYAYMVDAGLEAANKEFYLHCWDFLLGKMPTEHPGKLCENWEQVYKAYIPSDELWQSSLLKRLVGGEAIKRKPKASNMPEKVASAPKTQANQTVGDELF